MLTPVEMQGTVIKTGRGYKKAEMDAFLEEVFRDYESIYKENIELKDKLNTLSDGLQYYKDLEKTLQKTLVIAEKAADETRSAAVRQSETMELKAQTKADAIISSANKQAEAIVALAREQAKSLNSQLEELLKRQESYRIQCKQLATAQLELLDSRAFQLEPFEPVSIPESFHEERVPVSSESKEAAILPEHTASSQSASPLEGAVSTENHIPQSPKLTEKDIEDIQDTKVSEIEEALRKSPMGEVATQVSEKEEAPKQRNGQKESLLKSKKTRTPEEEELFEFLN